MSFSESKMGYEKWKDGQSYRLPGFPDGIPSNISVTQHAKYTFALSPKNQGMVGVAWLGKDEQDCATLYLDLLPAFNLNEDGTKPLMLNKCGKKYIEGETCAYTNEPLGGNSGRNHEQFLTIIQTRIQKAHDEKDDKTLKTYEGSYTLDFNNKVILDKRKLFGFGLFKSDDILLLNDFRSVSANINFESVERNPEYMYLFYFSPGSDINDSFQREYYLRRPIPEEIASRIKDELLENLPSDKPNEIIRVCLNNMPALDTYEQKEWLSIKDNPKDKINRLMATLCKFSDMKISKMNEIKEIIYWIKHNISLYEPRDPLLQQAVLKVFLDNVKYLDRNVFDIAASHRYQGIVDYFNEQTQIPSDHIFDQVLLCDIANNYDARLLKTLLKHNINAARQHIDIEDINIITTFILACSGGHLDLIKSLFEVCTQEQKKALIATRENGGFCNAVENGHLDLAKYLLSESSACFDFAEANAQEINESFVHSYIDGEIISLKTCEEKIVLNNEQEKHYFIVLRNLVRVNDLKEVEFFLTIPAIKTLLHAEENKLFNQLLFLAMILNYITLAETIASAMLPAEVSTLTPHDTSENKLTMPQCTPSNNSYFMFSPQSNVEKIPEVAKLATVSKERTPSWTDP